MAVLMRANPKPAIPLLENGTITRWFTANGWAYPVVGPTAPGMAAVQQFFEGLGLAKPPRLQLDDTTARFSCLRGEVVSGRASLSTSDRKWIFAHISSEVPWLRLTTPNVAGAQRTEIEFEIDARSLKAERVHETTLQILANSGQRLALHVRLEVRRPARPPRQPLRPLLMGALIGLFVRLALAGPGDIYGRVLTAAPTDVPVPGSLASWREAPLSTEFILHFVLATWWLGAVVGVVLVLKRGSRLTDLPCGLIAGAAGGAAVSSTLACLLPLLDWLPRSLWRQLAGGSGPAGASESIWLATAAWVTLAASVWMVLGALAGLCCALGRWNQTRA
jgi:hypothetical protein